MDDALISQNTIIITGHTLFKPLRLHSQHRREGFVSLYVLFFMMLYGRRTSPLSHHLFIFCF